MKWFLLIVLVLSGCSFDPGLRPIDPKTDASNNGRNNGQNNGDLDMAPDSSNNGNNGNNGTDASRDDAVPDLGQDLVDPVDVTDVATDSAEDMNTLRDCSGQIVDIATDPMNCGVCGNACDSNFGRCIGGICGCTDGFEACEAGNKCVDTGFDSKHCGGCNLGCGPGAACYGSVCGCRPEFAECNGGCVDLDRSPRHCGACGVDCGDNACRNGGCLPSPNCGVSYLACRQAGGGNACFRDDENDFFCGARIGDPCGEQCGGNEFCLDPGIFDRTRCFEFRPGTGCANCPCADCANDEACGTSPDAPGVAFCYK